MRYTSALHVYPTTVHGLDLTSTTSIIIPWFLYDFFRTVEFIMKPFFDYLVNLNFISWFLPSEKEKLCLILCRFFEIKYGNERPLMRYKNLESTR